MNQKDDFFHTIIKEACSELDVKVKTLSYNWIIELSKNGKIRHITGQRFDNNRESNRRNSS